MRNSTLLYGKGFLGDRIGDARNLNENLELESLNYNLNVNLNANR